MHRPVHVLVVAFHAPELLDTCLSGLEGQFATTVVDNSSDDHVRAVAERHCARYVDSGANLGFAAGANLGLRHLLRGPPVDVLLLNPDAVITSQDVHALSEVLHHPDNGRTGAVSPRVVDERGREQRVMWPFPRPSAAWLEAVGLGRLNRAEDFAIGAALLLRWETLHDVGLFDERFFLYAEETDWQRRAHQCGWFARLVPGIVVRHVGAATSTDAARREALFHAGTETYVRKWFGATGWAAYRAAALSGAAARCVVLRGEPRRRAAHRASLYVRGPRRAAGLT